MMFPRKIIAWGFLLLLFVSMIPIFTFNVGATTTTSLSFNGWGDYHQMDGNPGGPVSTNAIIYMFDLFTMTDVPYLGTISNVKVAVQVFIQDVATPGDGYIKIKTHSTEYDDASFAIEPPAYTPALHEKNYATNPNTLAAWTWTEINDLQAGIALKGDNLVNAIIMYQEFVNVTYTPILSVTTNTPTSITTNSATLNGAATGENGMTCGFWYNTAWTKSSATGTNTTASGTYDNGVAFSKGANMLFTGEYYHDRAWAYKAGVGFYKATENYFMSLPNKPSSIITGNKTGSSIEIRWVNSTVYSINRSTMVRYSTTGYPPDRTSGTLLYNGSFYRSYLTPWTPSTAYYFSAWTYVNDSHNSSRRMAWSSDYRTMTYTTASAPSGLTVVSFNSTQVVLSWTKGLNNTVVVRNTTGVYPATPWKGTTVYNGSAETYTNTGLDNTKKQYYRAWDFGTGFSIGNSSVSTYLRPGKPTSVNYKVKSGYQFINITWTNGTATKKTVVRRSATAQPTTPQEGTEVYNGTKKYYNMTSGFTQPYYFSLWSFNTTTGLFSDSVYLTYYACFVNCYKQSNGATLTPYTLFITNISGSQTYSHVCTTNPYIINVSSLPKGTNVQIVFNSTGYYPSAFYQDIAVNTNVYINAYLAINTTHLYVLSVVGQQFEYGTSPPISGVLVTIKKYINTTAQWQTISAALTDADGQTQVYLSSGTSYKVFLSKTGYNSTVEDFIPSPDVYTKTFRMFPVTPTIPDTEKFSDYISFTGDKYVNNSLSVSYSDSGLTTVNTTIYVYDVWNNTETLLVTNTTIGVQSFTFWVLGINTSHNHLIKLSYTNTKTFDVSSPVYLTLYGENISNPLGRNITKFDIEERFNGVFGINPLGWCNVLSVILPIILLVSFGPFYTGFGIITAGFSLEGVQFIFGAYFTNTLNPVLIGLGGFIIAIGIVYMWTRGGDDKI